MYGSTNGMPRHERGPRLRVAPAVSEVTTGELKSLLRDDLVASRLQCLADRSTNAPRTTRDQCNTCHVVFLPLDSSDVSDVIVF